MAAPRDEHAEAAQAVVLQRGGQALFGDAREALARTEQAVARDPQRREVGDRAAGTERPERMREALRPLRVELVALPVDQAMQHPDHLALERREGLRGLDLHDV